ncbi:Uncharacterized protein FKW44_018903, partial [Caligus rogercresseyi]
EEEETPIHLIFDCARTVKEMYQLAEESKTKKTPMEAQSLKIFDIFCKFKLFNNKDLSS